MPGLLVPIVEGQSEVRSIGGLLRRILGEIGVYDVDVARPFRVKRNQVVRPGELERAVTQAVRSRDGATGVIMLLDADDDCPASLGPALCKRCEQTTSVPAKVVLAKIETEAWILAGIDSVRGQRGIGNNALPPNDPESVQDAKRALSKRMLGSRGYVATDDQPALLSLMDLTAVKERSASFAKFYRDVSSLAHVSSPS